MTGLRPAASNEAAAAFLDEWFADPDLALVSDGVIAILAFEITSGGTLRPRSPTVELRSKIRLQIRAINSPRPDPINKFWRKF